MYHRVFLLLSVASLISPCTAGTPKVAKTECLPSKEDYTQFHCLSTATPPRIPCIDAEETECPNWAKRGECTNNPQYMLIHCRKSCDSCIDLHMGVVQMAPDDHLREQVLRRLIDTQEYMHRQAEISVRVLTKCVNKHDLCTHWSVQGECETNAGFMHTECAPACQTCDKIL